MTVFIPAYALSPAILGADGRTDGKYLIGFVNYICLVIVIDMIVFLATRNYNTMIWVLYIIAILIFFPLFVTLDHFTTGAMLEGEIFDNLFRMP